MGGWALGPIGEGERKGKERRKEKNDESEEWVLRVTLYIYIEYTFMKTVNCKDIFILEKKFM